MDSLDIHCDFIGSVVADLKKGNFSMPNIRAYAALNSSKPLEPFEFKRRKPGPYDVVIQIEYCGVCHSDLHQARNEWGGSTYPMVPGHEIVGKVIHVGSQVKKFAVGDNAGVGCFVDSCRSCPNCRAGNEQYCDEYFSGTYNSTEQDGTTPTMGGYSEQIVVDENYTLKIDPSLELARVAPLLCAGITTFSPLRQWNIGKNHKVAILGLGGLGHMAVKLAASFGAEVSVLSSSPAKEADAKRLGANNFVLTSNPKVFSDFSQKFDFIIDTVSASHDLNQYLELIKTDGTLILLGVPEKPAELSPGNLIFRRRRLAGSLIGGIKETQEMLDYCADKKILSDVEVIPIQQINQAYERLLKGDVKYRFVIDMKSL